MKVIELKREVDAQFIEVRDRFDRVESKIDASVVETRRHFDVIAEQLRSEIRLIASGVAATNERLDRSSVEHEGDRKALVAALDEHEVRLRILERSGQ